MKNLLCIAALTLLNNFCFAQEKSILKRHKMVDLYQDYDLLVHSLKEAHPGLYWYTNRTDFERLFVENRAEINDGMTTYEFYKIVSRILSADREGHSSVSASKDIRDFVNLEAKYLPFSVKTLGEKLYLLNDIGNMSTIGHIVTHINKVPIDSIIEQIFEHTSSSSDGFTTTGKFRDLDGFGFSGFYMDFIDHALENVDITIQHPIDQETHHLSVNLVDKDSLRNLSRKTRKVAGRHSDLIYHFETLPNSTTSILTFNTFDYSRFKKQNLDFRSVVDSIFLKIKNENIHDLIIDVRNVGGGTEGAEDYLFSYLTSEPYEKYQYVEANGFTFSFLNDTIYRDLKKELENMLLEEHKQTPDGRILRKKSILPTVKPQKSGFDGNLFILCSGKTYSGGSEFVSIARAYSKAIVIGEETGGGFYGQTSGSYIQLVLPHTQMKVRIPLLKFYTTFENDQIPFGRGVIPDHTVRSSFDDFIKGVDSEMSYTLELIGNI